MTVHRPTTLKLATRHCPRATTYYEDKRAQFRDHFGTGIAAHAVLEHLGAMAVEKGAPLTEGEIRQGAQTAAKQLLSTGRTFDGEQEPPLAADQVTEGAFLAVRWALEHPLSHTAKYELGVGFDADWKSVGYSNKDARFRLIFDVFDTYVEANDEQTASGLAHTDYKSAWSTDGDELYTVQLKAQTVAAYECAVIFGDKPSFIRREVVNLRTQESIATTLWLDQNGEATIAAWKAEIAAHMKALDDMPTPRPARPGHGCMGCPWVTSCEDAKAFLSEAVAGVTDNATDKTTLAKAYCVARGTSDMLAGLLRKATEEDAIVVLDGVVVGTIAKDGNDAKDDGGKLAWDEWAKQGGDVDGFLAALKPGVTSLKGLAKKLRPRKPDEQEAMLSQWLEPKTKREFGIHDLRKTET